MPAIRSSTSLRNDYSKISKYCHESGEPVYVTVNGQGDLAVMSIDAFEKRERTMEIREKLLEARLQKAEGVPLLDFDEAMSELEALAHDKVINIRNSANTLESFSS